LQENWNSFFGGVVLFDNAAFERINGYSNAYWGWGFEDTELRRRGEIAGLEIERRDGTFSGLSHKHRGYTATGTPTPEALATRAVFAERQQNLVALMAIDGLSSLSFTCLRSDPVRLMDREVPHATHHLVDIGGPM
jgi:hypothetical protein